jgi:hypothetical protein
MDHPLFERSAQLDHSQNPKMAHFRERSKASEREEIWILSKTTVTIP